jgi:hypothetical protein
MRVGEDSRRLTRAGEGHYESRSLLYRLLYGWVNDIRASAVQRRGELRLVSPNQNRALLRWDLFEVFPATSRTAGCSACSSCCAMSRA